MSPAVREWLERVTVAYASQPIEISGTFEQDFDVQGTIKQERLALSGIAHSRGCFRHVAGEAMMMVADGRSITLFDPRSTVYQTDALSPDGNLPGELLEILALQNPAIAVAATGDAAVALIPRDAKTEVVPPDAEEGGQAFARLRINHNGMQAELWIRERDGRIDRVHYDFSDALKAQGAMDVIRATATIRYGETKTPADEQVKRSNFEFRPPSGARNASADPPATAPSNR